MSASSWSSCSENILSDKFPLHRACRDGDVTALAALLHDGSMRSHLELEDAYYRWTPAHWCAYFGRLDCMRLLSGHNKLGLTTPPDLRTKQFNQTPAHIAAFAGHPQFLQWLLLNGASPEARDYLGETPLHKASRTGSSECVSLLVAHKTSTLSFVNNNSQTAAQLADACGHKNISQHIVTLQQSQGPVKTTCSIARSIPSHGINAGLFPPTTTTNTPLVSANGYYGAQPNGTVVAQSNGSQMSDDCDMETDSEPVPNGATNGQIVNGATNGHSANKGVLNGHNIFNGALNGQNTLINGDITINPSIIHNHIPVGGRKRSREESPEPEMKRSRIQGPENEECIARQAEAASTPQQPANKTDGFQNPFYGKHISGSRVCMGSMMDHACSIGVEKVYEMANIEMMHGC